MKTRLVQIGKTKAVRIPAVLLAKTLLPNDVDVTAINDSLVVRPIRKRRSGWSAACAQMRKHGDDQLLDAKTSPNTWDQEEWEW